MVKRPELPKVGSKVIIRKLEVKDLDQLYNIESDSEVMRYVGKPVCMPRKEWINGMERRLSISVVLAILAKENNHFVGRAAIGNYRSDVDREIQVVISKDYQDRHFGREVCKILIAAAFDELDAEQVVGIVHPENKKSLKLLQLFGFEKDGVISDQSPQHGRIKFVLTRSDYKKWTPIQTNL